MRYQDGYQSPVSGSINGQSTYGSLDLAFGEAIISGLYVLFMIWKRCGRLLLINNRGKRLDISGSENVSYQYYAASGPVAGMLGVAGDDVDRLGF